MSEPAKQKILLVFLSECDTTDKKPGLVFLRVTREQFEAGAEVPETEDNCMTFAKKGMTVGQPGNVYEYDAIEKEEGRFSIFPGSRRHVGQWPDADQRVKWEGGNRAFVTNRDAKKMEKNTATKSMFAEALAPFREKYRRLPYPHRQAFLAAVLYEVTR